MEFVYNDGGRSQYFKATNVGDCVTRAICNASGLDYKFVYDRLKEMAKKESTKHHRGHKKSSVRDGVFKETWKRLLNDMAWEHQITAKIGQAEKVHLTDDELPNNKIMIVQVSKHLTCIKNGILYDTYDCSRDGERMVYGYWEMPANWNPQKYMNDFRKGIEDKEASRKQKEKDKKKLDAEIKKIKSKYKDKMKPLKKKIRELEKQMQKEIDALKGVK